MFAGSGMSKARKSESSVTMLPTYGRFLQADPLGYEDGMNMYAYVGNDPVNFSDPTGLEEEIVVIGKRTPTPDPEFCPPGQARVEEVGGPINGTCGVVDTWYSEPTRDLVDGAGVGEEITVIGRRNPVPSALSLATTPPRAISTRVVFGPRRMRSDVCGSSGNSPLVPESLGASNMVEPCRRHDRCYGTLGANRSACDERLKQDMLRSCSRNGMSPMCVIGSYVFYAFLRALGRGPFNDAQLAAMKGEE